MAIVTTINNLAEVILPIFIECFKEDAMEGKIIEGAEYLQELMEERIFERGEATDGDIINSVITAQKLYNGGPYSEGHGFSRDAAGLQTGLIDLQFTGALRAALTVGEFDNKVAIGFSSERTGLLATYHEEYRQKEIFLPTDNEVELTAEFMTEGLAEYLKECLESQP